MDTPNSSNPASDAELYQDQIADLLDDGEETDVQVPDPYEPSPFQQLKGRLQQNQQQQVTGQKGPRRSYMGREGKNAVPVIDGDILQRWNVEIGDVLADSAATSSVILPGPPISSVAPANSISDAGSLPPPPVVSAPQQVSQPQQPHQPSTGPLNPAK